MDFKDTPEQAKFRKTCRDWLDKNAQLKTSILELQVVEII